MLSLYDLLVASSTMNISESSSYGLLVEYRLEPIMLKSSPIYYSFQQSQKQSPITLF